MSYIRLPEAGTLCKVFIEEVLSGQGQEGSGRGRVGEMCSGGEPGENVGSTGDQLQPDPTGSSGAGIVPHGWSL